MIFWVSCIRPDQVQLIDTYQYEDNQEGDEDAFSREPFILRFGLPDRSNYSHSNEMNRLNAFTPMYLYCI